MIFYSYTISILVIYFYYQTNRVANIHMNTFILQFLLSLIYIQMINIRSDAHIYTIQRRLEATQKSRDHRSLAIESIQRL